MARVRQTMKLDPAVELKQLQLDDGAEKFLQQVRAFGRGLGRKMKTKEWADGSFVSSWAMKPMRTKDDPFCRNTFVVLPLNSLLCLYMAVCNADERLQVIGKLLAACRSMDHGKKPPINKHVSALIRSGRLEDEELAKHCTKSVLCDLLTYAAFNAGLNEYGDSPELFRKLRSLLPDCMAECLAGSDDEPRMCAACQIDEAENTCSGATLYVTMWADKARYLVAMLILRALMSGAAEGTSKCKAEIITLLSLCQVKFKSGSFMTSQRIVSLSSNRFLWSGLF